MMAPAPNIKHQTASIELSRQIGNFLKDKSCKVFASPIDVRLNPNDEDDCVVQPDIVVVCDKSKIGEKSIVGAPDVVFEILSPSSMKHDRVVKFALYREAGVKEYWIVDPDGEFVERHNFTGDEGTREAYDVSNDAPSLVLKGLTIELADLFEKPDTAEEAVAQE